MTNRKFRLWDDKNKKWLLGYDYPNLGGFSMFGEIMAFGEYTKVLGSFSLDDWDRLKLMQYTELNDRHGKEIYEGDILVTELFEDIKDLYEVVFNFGCFWVKEENSARLFPLHEEIEGMAIAGNIYENPNLITYAARKI